MTHPFFAAATASRAGRASRLRALTPILVAGIVFVALEAAPLRAQPSPPRAGDEPRPAEGPPGDAPVEGGSGDGAARDGVADEGAADEGARTERDARAARGVGEVLARESARIDATRRAAGAPDPDDELHGVLLPEERLFWQRARARWFAAGAIDVGYIYFRPRFTFGYGKPHFKLAGLEINPIFTSEGVGAWLGLRGVLPFVELRAGARYFFTFRRSLLAPRNSFDRLDVEDRSERPSRYLAFETELSGGWRLGPGNLLYEGALTAVTGTTEGLFVFEETVRVVVDPPWIWRARAGYSFVLGPQNSISLAPVVELVGIPNRDVVVLRAGVVASMWLFHDLEIRGTFVPPILSRDSLGPLGGDSYQIGIRYRFATGTAVRPD